MLAGVSNLNLVRQVQSRAAMATIQDHPHAHALGQWLDDVGVQLVVSDLAYMLEVTRDQCIVHAALFIAILVLDLPTMAAVVEEKLIPWDRLGSEPAQRGQYVRLGGHHVRPIVAQSADLTVLKSKGILQDPDNGIGVVDAAGELALPWPKAKVIDADRQSFAHRSSAGLDGRRHQGLGSSLGLRHEASTKVHEFLRGELGHLLEALLL
mmetsp:Transcript_130654/g.418985  ORF Transcript_130654/g.418985 Transcript_130654/m.418985 type:complete len:209 (-) Transcript_130654:2129-2755(-)